MASNPYVNKVGLANGTTLIDLSQDTATQADVAQGKYFHLPTGERVQGTGSGGGGSITQDQDGYLVLSPDGDVPTLITKTITQNGTYDAEDDNADGYSSVTVNVSGGGGGNFTTATMTIVTSPAYSGKSFAVPNIYTDGSFQILNPTVYIDSGTYEVVLMNGMGSAYFDPMVFEGEIDIEVTGDAEYSYNYLDYTGDFTIVFGSHG